MFRIWFKVILPIVFASISVFASVAHAYEVPQPYFELSSDTAREYPEYFKTVTVFMQFHCPYCYSLHRNKIGNWGKTLPSNWKFQYVPVVSEERDHTGAAVYYSILDIAPDRASDFMDKALFLIHEKGADSSRLETFVAAASQVGIDRKLLLDHIQNTKYSKRMKRAIQFAESSLVDRVPLVGIGAKTVADPAAVLPDYGLFIRMLNGLVSQQLTIEDAR